MLFPDVDLEVRGPDTGEPVMLTVREFRFREGLEAQVIARPLIGAIARLAEQIGEGGEGLDTVAVDAVIGEHAGVWLALIARACSREVEWLERLSDAEGRELTLVMWEVNGRFFYRAHRGGGDERPGGGEPVPLARVLDALVRAGHGRGHRELCERLTWRQIERFWREAEHRRIDEASTLAQLLFGAPPRTDGN